jgi:monoamine oxidase
MIGYVKWGGNAVLMVFLVGNSARQMSAMAEQEAVQDILMAGSDIGVD